MIIVNRAVWLYWFVLFVVSFFFLMMVIALIMLCFLCHSSFVFFLIVFMFFFCFFCLFILLGLCLSTCFLVSEFCCSSDSLCDHLSPLYPSYVCGSCVSFYMSPRVSFACVVFIFLLFCVFVFSYYYCFLCFFFFLWVPPNMYIATAIYTPSPRLVFLGFVWYLGALSSICEIGNLFFWSLYMSPQFISSLDLISLPPPPQQTTKQKHKNPISHPYS